MSAATWNNASDASAVATNVVDKIADPASRLLLTLIEKTGSAIETGVNFLSEQIPDVLRQLLMYNLIVSVAWFTVGVAIVCFGLWIIKSSFKATDKMHAEYAKALSEWEEKSRDKFAGRMPEREEEFLLPMCVFAAIIIVVGMSVMAFHMDWLKIWIAPKIYLLEYAADLYKNFRGR
ncbi:hypothetical protein RsoM2USA_392 [Ralstonia phage RsoM2USA]|nr:hypothetical protein RsoM2USA_392 [Ralstonia phage RsoM2USA]